MGSRDIFTLSYSLLRVAIAMVLYLAVAAVLLGYLLTDVEKSLPVWLIAIICALFWWQAVRMGLVLRYIRGPVLTMSDDGIEISKPELGRLPWTRVEAIDLGSSLLHRNTMSIFFDTPPVEKPRFAWLYYPLAKALLNDPATFQIHVFLTDCRTPDLQDALARFWPGAEQPVKYDA